MRRAPDRLTPCETWGHAARACPRAGDGDRHARQDLLRPDEALECVPVPKVIRSAGSSVPKSGFKAGHNRSRRGHALTQTPCTPTNALP